MEILDKLIYQYLARKHKERTAIFVNDCIGFHVICHGIYEKKEIDIILNSLSSNTFKNTFIDVGANIGNHTRYFSKYFKNVIGFEPQTDLFTLLKLNTSESKNTEIYNFGLSDKESSKKIFFDDLNRMGGSYHKKAKNFEETDLKCFDNHFQDENISFIKIDVEGHELKALIGMRKSIKKHKPIIAFEGKTDSIGEIIDLLKGYSYNQFWVPNDYFINKIIKSKNYFLVMIRYFFRLMSFAYKPKLIKLNKNEIINPKKDYNLVVALNQDSNFKLK
jgi:FkbM family methyltransferase